MSGSRNEGECVLQGICNSNNAIEPADPKHPADMITHGAEHELSFGLLQGLGRKPRHPYAGAADVIQMGKIHDHALLPTINVAHHQRLKFPGINAVQPAFRRQYQHLSYTVFFYA